MDSELNVVVRELPAVRVVVLEYRGEGWKGGYSESIGMLFRELEGWLAHRHIRVDRLLRFGVPFNEGERLVSYWCCIEAPEGVTAGEGAVAVRDLAGGRYAVLTLDKDSATIGHNIDRFHSEYVPAHGLALDPSRPPIEVYHPNTMEYRAPVV